MSREEKKARKEIAIFIEFVERASLPVDLSSIEKRHPPEPDILCKHLKQEYVAFELGEICDPNIAESLSMNSEGAFWTSDLSERIIRNKLLKRYETKHQLELLFYTDGRVVTPDDMIISKIKHCTEKIPHGFRRIWLLGKGAYSVC